MLVFTQLSQGLWAAGRGGHYPTLVGPCECENKAVVQQPLWAEVKGPHETLVAEAE